MDGFPEDVLTSGPMRAARLRHGARWGLLVLALLLGVVLCGGAWTRYSYARGLFHILAIGQADAYFMALRPEGPPEPGWSPDVQDLQRTLRGGAEEGLRYLAVLPPHDDRVRLEVGATLPGWAQLPVPQEGQVQRLLGRVRVLRPLFGKPPWGPPPPLLGPGPDWPRGLPPPPRPPPRVLVEFEPLRAAQLVRSAAWQVGLSAAAALLLMGAVAVLFHTAARADAATAEWLHRRHLAALGEMSAVLAHEIRNPLASLKGHAQLLAEQTEDAPARRSADRVVQEAQRLEQLTRQLLDFARTGTIDRREVDPGALLRDAVQSALGQFQMDPGRSLPPGALQRAAIDLDIDQAPARWSLDATRVRQVLNNLIQNALQSSPVDAPPQARVHVEGDRLVYTVRDHGPGIPKDEQERIFTPFHTTRAKGTGLGLAVARRIVELHGGTLTAHNHPAGGAVFCAVLPGRVPTAGGADGEHPGRR